MEGVGVRVERVCADCGGNDFVEVHSEGDIVCRGCGRVAAERIIDERSEWRTFGDKDKEGDDPSRVGGATNMLLESGGLGTTIGRVAGDGGASFALNRMHMRQNTSDRALRTAFAAIGETCARLHQTDKVKSRAFEIYKKVHDSKSLRGRKSDLVYMACVLVASRKEGTPLQFKELGALYRGSEPKGTPMTQICKGLYACYKVINDLEQAGGQASGAAGPSSGGAEGKVVNAESVMPRCLTVLGFEGRGIRQAVNVGVAVERLGKEQSTPWSGKNPMTVIGAVIYGIVQLEMMRSGAAQGVTQDRLFDEVAKLTGMAPTTISAAFSDMLPVWYQSNDLIPAAYATKEQLAALGAKLGVDVTAGPEAGGGKKAKKKRKAGQ